MFKKVGLTALVAVIALGLLSRTDVGRWAWSHIRLAGNEAREGLRSMVSLETEIKRLDKEIDELKNEVAASYKPLAREMVEVELLKKEIARDEKDVSAREKTVRTAKADLDTARSRVGIGSDASVQRLERDFTASWKSFEVAERTLKTKKEVLQRKEELVAQAQAKIKAMNDRREMLKTQLADLRTNLEAVRVAQMKSSVKIEEGRFADVERDLANVEKRVKELSTELSLKEKFTGGNSDSVEDKVDRAKAEEEFEARFGAQEDVVRKDK
jgi:chromosome segregation ATPase